MCWVILASTILPPGMSRRRTASGPAAKIWTALPPTGPVITDEVDPEHLTITTRLNGQVVQQGRTEQLITGVRALISFITASMTLEPGDVIATGTPAGVGPMQPGDTVEVEVSGIGILCNSIV